MLSAILIGNNIVNLSASAIATSLAYSFGGYMVSIATAVLTVMILVFGEITPKNYATMNNGKINSKIYTDHPILYDRFDSVYFHHQPFFARIYVSAPYRSERSFNRNDRGRASYDRRCKSRRRSNRIRTKKR